MSDSNEDILKKLAPSVVEIISDKDSTALGTGFVVTEDGVIVTCRHVITDDDKLMNTVWARFYSDFEAAGGNRRANAENIPKYTMNLVKEYTRDPSVDSLDIAFFKLDVTSLYEQNKKLTPVELDDKIVSLNDFVSIGFRKADELTGLIARGDIGIPTNIKTKGGLLSPRVIQLYHKKQIEPGMSGAPVFDTKRNRVVGIITERYKPIDYTDEDTLAFALPVAAMIELYPKLREKNQGLTLLSKFLRLIGEESSSIYKWIDDVYVPPIEYEEIKASLKNKRIVFITGTKEFGKTFTAVRLMYEFFKEEGYQPRWIKERKEEGRPAGSDPQELARIMHEVGYIKPHQIVYFEDPFGKMKYERSSDLENYIGSIINSIKNLEDAYVIITSREEVFKQFRTEHLTSIDLENFEKKMNLKRASYDSKKRKEMLHNWARIVNCKWLLKPALTDLVLQAIKNQKLLPTPLNIKEFAIASYAVLDTQQLRNLIKQISEETTGRFADEIIRMEEDEKVLFLALPYVGSGNLYVFSVEKMFENIITTRESSQKHYMDFQRVRKWFEGDKINISEHKIAFSHPSYYEAFRYAIDSEKRYNDKISSARIRDIFIEVLLKLVDCDEAELEVATAIIDNFDRLPSHVQQLLFKLADKYEVPGDLAEVISRNFNRLPADIREQLLLKLADNGDAETALYIAEVISRNFNKLPSHVQQLLFKLADNDETAEYMAYAIAENFDKLPPNILEQLFLKLVDNDETASTVASTIAENFDKLPRNVQRLLFKLADNDETASTVASSIEDNFDKLPAYIREQLLIKLADKDNAAISVSSIMKKYGKNIPDDIRKEILRNS